MQTEGATMAEEKKKVVKRDALTDEQIIGVKRLADGAKTPTEVADALEIPHGTINYIIKRLRENGHELKFRRKSDAWTRALTVLEKEKGA